MSLFPQMPPQDKDCLALQKELNWRQSASREFVLIRASMHGPWLTGTLNTLHDSSSRSRNSNSCSSGSNSNSGSCGWADRLPGTSDRPPTGGCVTFRANAREGDYDRRLPRPVGCAGKRRLGEHSVGEITSKHEGPSKRTSCCPPWRYVVPVRMYSVLRTLGTSHMHHAGLQSSVGLFTDPALGPHGILRTGSGTGDSGWGRKQ